jgi:tetratricopeptide (TPR) repeat protein
MAIELPDIRAEWNFGDTKKSRANFENLIKKYSTHEEYILELKTQIARTLGIESSFDEAHKLLDEVNKSLKENQKTAIARYYIERGRVYNSDNKRNEAVQEFLKALEASKVIKHEHLIVDSAHMLAIAGPKFKDQKKWTEIALEEAKKAKDSKVQDWRGSLLNNWGSSLFEQKQYKEAMKIFKDALEFRKTKSNTEAIIIAKWSVARTHRALNEVDKALVIQLSLIKEWDKIGKKDGYVYEELGEIYLLTKEDEKRKKYFQMAYEELSKDKWFVKNESKKLDRLGALSK